MPKKRTKKALNLLPVLHIYCEGEETEPNYLTAYIDNQFPGNKRLKVIKIESTSKNTPRELVQEAVNAKNHKNTPDHDSFWVVYDRESPQKYKVDLHKQAYNNAKQNNIHVALSSVCFEVWILLHFQPTVAAYECYADLAKHSALHQHCKERGLDDYSKADQKLFNLLAKHIDEARQRAPILNTNTIKSSDSSCSKPYQWNPYTDVYKLLDAIDEFGKQHIF